MSKEKLLIRLACERDIPNLKTLWLHCFPEDNAGDVDAFFSVAWPLADCLVGETADSRLACMLFLLPAVARWEDQTWPVRYLYAGGTLTEFRGRGYYSALLETAAGHVARRGEQAIYLYPANADLISLYERAGYRHGIRKCSDKEKALSDKKQAVYWEPVPPIAALFARCEELDDTAMLPEEALWLPLDNGGVLTKKMETAGGFTVWLGE